jgi:hypothetical protein
VAATHDLAKKKAWHATELPFPKHKTGEAPKSVTGQHIEKQHHRYRVSGGLWLDSTGLTGYAFPRSA